MGEVMGGAREVVLRVVSVEVLSGKQVAVEVVVVEVVVVVAVTSAQPASLKQMPAVAKALLKARQTVQQEEGQPDGEAWSR